MNDRFIGSFEWDQSDQCASACSISRSRSNALCPHAVITFMQITAFYAMQTNVQKSASVGTCVFDQFKFLDYPLSTVDSQDTILKAFIAKNSRFEFEEF